MLQHILNPPTEEMRVKILEDSNEDPGRLEHNLNLLEKWISCENHLPKNYDRNLLEGYLRGCKHNMETTKRKLELYFIEKANLATLLRNRILTMDHDLKITSMICTYCKEFSPIYCCRQSFPLPEMTTEGYRILLRKLEIKDISLFNMFDVIRYDALLYDIRLHYDIMSAGQVMVYDLSNTNVPSIQKILTPDFWRITTFVRNSLPFRLKQFHIVTSSSIIIKIVTLMKTFFPEKLAKRFHVHANMEGVFKYIPQKLFPSDYGGTKKPCRELTEDWKAALVELDVWFRQLDEMQIIGPIPKRVEQNYSEYFGTEGSFRKLDID